MVMPFNRECPVCHTVYVSGDSMHFDDCPTCYPKLISDALKDGELVFLRLRVKELESQLAAEASAVETLGKVEANLRSDKDAWVTVYVNADWHSFLAERMTSRDWDDECGNGVTTTGATLLAALAALVQAEGKEAGK